MNQTTSTFKAIALSFAFLGVVLFGFSAYKYTNPNGQMASVASAPITIGEPNILPTDDNGNANLLVSQSTTLSQSGTIQSLSFYVTNAAGNLRLGIYDATGPNNGPGNLKANTAEMTTTTGWNTANVVTPTSLPAGNYWLAYFPSNNNLAFRKTQNGSSSGKTYSMAYGALPQTFPTSPSNTASHWSFYGTVNTTSAPTATLTLNPSSIAQGQSSTITWSSTDATSCTGTNFTASGTSGSQTVTPAGSTNYSISCTGSGGTASQNALLTVYANPGGGLYTLSLTRVGTGQGIISSSPSGLACTPGIGNNEGICLNNFAPNSTTTLSIVNIGFGSSFGNWSGCTQVTGSGQTSLCKVFMNGNKNVTITINGGPQQDTIPPVISSIASSTSQTGVTITWNTNEASDSQVEYGLTTSYGNSTTLNSSMVTTHSVALSGLTANTTYHFRVKSKDAAGNLGTSVDYIFNTQAVNPPPDTQPPTIPTGLTAQAVSSSQINLSWTASTDNVAVTGYKIFRNGAQVNTSPTNSYSDTGLSAATSYIYTVSAYDAAGNNSAQSAPLSATTQAAGGGGNSYYIRDGGTGSSCSDWSTANACDTLPSTLTRNATYYIADGTYAGRTFNTAVNGSQLITIKKATDGDHGAGANWTTAMGDGQAAFTSQIAFTTSNWLFDGVTGGGPGSWESGYGFQITETGASNAAILIGQDVTANNVTVRHIHTIGMANGGTNGGAAGNDGVAIYGDTGSVISYVWTEGAGRCPFFFPPNIGDTTVEYSHVTQYSYGSGIHSEIASIDTASGNVTFRYNLIQWSTSTGGIEWGDGVDGTSGVFPNAKMYVYGNVFYLLSNEIHTNGNAVGTWTNGIMHHVYMYNNTFINVPDAIFYDGNGDSTDVIAKNNLFFTANQTAAPDFGNISHTYNHYISPFSNQEGGTGGTGSTGTSNPFVHYPAPNWDFSLVSNTATGTPITNVTGQTFDVDMLGHPRNTWTRGAVQFTGGTPPPPTATLTANPTSITSGGSSTLTWSSTNATSCTGTGGTFAGSHTTSGSQSVSPTVTTTYGITCTGTGGTSPNAPATVTVGTGQSSCTGTCFYIKQGGTGNGSSWASSTSAIPSNLVRGATYYIADGTYAGVTLNNVSGTATTTIKKATVADHGTGSGWLDTMGDGQAQFTGEITIDNSYLLFDGVTGGGPGNWKGTVSGQPYGFKFNIPTDSAFYHDSSSISNVIIRHVEVAGNNCTTETHGCFYNGLLFLGGNVNNFTVSYVYTHDLAGNVFDFRSTGDNLLVEYAYVGSFGSSPAHAEAFWFTAYSYDGNHAIRQHKITVRNSVLNDLRADALTGGIMMADSDGVQIYGNVFYRPNGQTFTYGGNGVVSKWSGYNLTNVKVYNNDFIHMYGLYGGLNVNFPTDDTFTATNIEAYNNIFYDAPPAFDNVAAHDYNYYVGIPGSETHSPPQGSNDPFQGWQADDFRLINPSTVSGKTSSQFNNITFNNVDPLGNIRGQDGTWDLGAYEYHAGTGPFAPIQNPPSTPPSTPISNPPSTNSGQATTPATSPSPTSGSTTYVFIRNLSFSSSGSDVVALQNILISQGYLAPGNNIGIFGSKTRAALSAYQRAHGITPSAGYFGPKTRAFLNASISSGEVLGASTKSLTSSQKTNLDSSANSSVNGRTQYELTVSKYIYGKGEARVFSTGVPQYIDCGTQCSALLDPNTVVSLKVEAGPGLDFVQWTGACEHELGLCVITMSEAKSVTAIFETSPTPYPIPLHVSKTGSGSGTVTSNPSGINCGPTCTAEFNSWTTVTLTPSPASGSVFSGWSGLCSGTDPCSVRMTGESYVTAQFDVDPTFSLWVTKAGTGSGRVFNSTTPRLIDCGAICSNYFSKDSIVFLKAEPQQNSIFVGWEGACTNSGVVCAITMNAVKNVIANFKIPTVIITSPLNNATVSGSVTINAESPVFPVTSMKFIVDGNINGAMVDNSAPWSVIWDSRLVSNGSHYLKAQSTYNNHIQDSLPVYINVVNTNRPGQIIPPTNPDGCQPGYLFSTTTGMKCSVLSK